ncbi:hypothetical protein ABIF64_000573 [Bradyrhizobium japonicum]|uniref:hypothetical protein n=1 Tax=Bradyrhizobium japonicum TaxID=375 RepID=UPI00339127A0
MAQRTGLLRTSLRVILYDFGLDFGSMDSDYDPEREAEAAMKLAAATDGPERQRWISLAMAWQEIARMRSPSMFRAGSEEAA